MWLKAKLNLFWRENTFQKCSSAARNDTDRLVVAVLRQAASWLVAASSSKETAHKVDKLASTDKEKECKLSDKLTQTQLEEELLLPGHTSAAGLSS